MAPAGGITPSAPLKTLHYREIAPMAEHIYPPEDAFAASAHADKATYEAMYAASISDPVAFWGEQGKRVDWMTPYTKVKNTTFEHAGVSIKWYEDGELNVLIATSPLAAIKPLSSGKVTTLRTARISLTISCTQRFASWPMSINPSA
jgi:hypothetical protein